MHNIPSISNASAVASQHSKCPNPVSMANALKLTMPLLPFITKKENKLNIGLI